MEAALIMSALSARAKNGQGLRGIAFRGLIERLGERKRFIHPCFRLR